MDASMCPCTLHTWMAASLPDECFVCARVHAAFACGWLFLSSPATNVGQSYSRALCDRYILGTALALNKVVDKPSLGAVLYDEHALSRTLQTFT